MRSEETVYFSGKDYFDSLFKAIDLAKTEILIETYIFEKGVLTQKLVEKLKAALHRGVQIKMTVDAAGSYGQIDELEELNKLDSFQLSVFHPILWSDLFNSLKFLNRRIHRKLCIIDSHLAFTGSLNISDVHVVDSDDSKAWKDFGVSFSGADVQELIKAFQKVFYKVKITKKIKRVFFENKKNTQESGLFLNDTRLKRKECYRNLRNQIMKAQKRIWIANAYMLPDFRIQTHLEDAAIRGVDVRLLTSGTGSDVFFMPWLTRLYYNRGLTCGIKLFEYLPSFFHGKVFLFDDYVSIGTSNLNYRSIFHDLELDVVIQDKENLQKTCTELQKCFDQSAQINTDDLKKIPLWQNLIAKVLSLFKYWF
jgi:cardiolipin synthase